MSAGILDGLVIRSDGLSAGVVESLVIRSDGLSAGVVAGLVSQIICLLLSQHSWWPGKSGGLSSPHLVLTATFD